MSAELVYHSLLTMATTLLAVYHGGRAYLAYKANDPVHGSTPGSPLSAVSVSAGKQEVEEAAETAQLLAEATTSQENVLELATLAPPSAATSAPVSPDHSS